MFDYQNLDEAQKKAVMRALVLENPYIKQVPHPKQAQFLLNFKTEVLFGGSAGSAKDIYSNTPILTSMGITTIENLEIGDTVYDEKGNPCLVLAKSETFYNKDCYKLYFSDGSEIIASDTHLWPAVSIAEELQLIRHTDEYRAKRRAIRPSRGTGKKPWLAKLNSEREYKYLPEIAIRNKTTQELFENHRCGKRNRANYYIPVCKPLKYTKKNLIVDPYVLGAWLGDGHTSDSAITGMDEEIFTEISKRGYHVTPRQKTITRNIDGLVTQLRKIGCYKNKHIPVEYLNSSVKQRVDLLRGLMDTDGYASTEKGQCGITLTRKVLIDDISMLLHSLGIKHQIHEHDAKLYGKIVSKCWKIGFYTNIKVFNLKRKSLIQKRSNFRSTVFRRYIEKIEKVESVPTQCIQVSSPSGQFLVGNSLIPTHNSSSLLMAALMFVGYPNYNAIIFRKTYADLALPGALISRSHEWLQGTDAKWVPTEHKWIFPSGATLSFGYLDSENSRFRYQGSEVSFCAFDELTQFKEEDYLYLFSRLRKNEGSKIPLRMRSASNPGGIGHEWTFKRFFVEHHPDREFIPAKLVDNPSIQQEEYIKSLSNLDPVTRAQLLDGNWTVLREGRKFKREWFENSFIDADQVPTKGLTVRYWDLAATEPKKGQDPDWTVGAKVKLYDGIYYIEDIRRTRSNPGDVEKLIRDTANMDGHSVLIYIEQEPGASGKIVIDDFARRVLSGYAFYGDKATGSKEIRSNIFSAAAYNRLVKIVRAPWNAALIDELVAFPNKDIKDDQVDGCSGCFSKLMRMESDNSTKNVNEIYLGGSYKEDDRLSYKIEYDQSDIEEFL